MASKQKPSFDTKLFLAKVGEGRSIGKYRKDEIVFSQGDPADAVFYIQEGKVKVAVVSERGKEAVVAILGPDDFFGEGCLAGQPRRMATVSTMTNGLFMRLEKASVVRVIHDEPAFSEIFIAHLLARTIRVEEDLIDQLFNSSEKRLALPLRRAAVGGPQAGPRHFDLGRAKRAHERPRPASMPMAGDACLVARLRGAPAITGTRQNGVELVANELFDKSPHLLTQGRLDRIEPVATTKKLGTRFTCRLRTFKRRANAGHGVVSRPALQRRVIRGW